MRHGAVVSALLTVAIFSLCRAPSIDHYGITRYEAERWIEEVLHTQIGDTVFQATMTLEEWEEFSRSPWVRYEVKVQSR